jgi:hypothetical protein
LTEEVKAKPHICAGHSFGGKVCSYTLSGRLGAVHSWASLTLLWIAGMPYAGGPGVRAGVHPEWYAINA